MSISRSGTDWGIPLPWDPKHVVYVWVDALLNYATAVGFGTDPVTFERMWPADLHIIGKDIVRFHAIIWPALLMAAGVEVPKTVFAHGFINVGGEKMSKSSGTGTHPFELLDHFGVDSYRYYFMREISFGQDGNFSWESMTERHNADLANGLGNLASRVLAMLASYFDGVVPEPVAPDAQSDLPAVIDDALGRYDELMLAVQLQPALVAVWDIVDRANHYLVEKEPWKLAKDPANRDELASVLYAAAETLRVLAVAIAPIMPCGRREPLVPARHRRAARRPAAPRGRHLGRPGSWHDDDERRVAVPSSRDRLTGPGGAIAEEVFSARLHSGVRLARIMFHVKLPPSTACGDPCSLGAREQPEPSTPG